MKFDPSKYVIKVQGKQYLPVSARLIWFREEHPDWGIVTEIVEINNEEKYAIFRANIFNEEGRVIATATKKEDVKGFGDWIEKSETGSVGRALAMCGYGAQFEPDLAGSSMDARAGNAEGERQPRPQYNAPPPRPAPPMSEPIRPTAQRPTGQVATQQRPAAPAPAQRPRPAPSPITNDELNDEEDPFA
jgi:hypothetical protein